MKETESAREAAGFLEYWKKHPLSIPILILIFNSTFLLVIIQGTVDTNKLYIADLFAGLSLIIFLVVMYILVKKRYVLYNATELLTHEIERSLVDIKELLTGIEIGIGVAFDNLRAPPLSEELNNYVIRYELLAGMLKHIDYEPETSDATNKALARYYFRKGNNKKGIEWIDKVNKEQDSDYYFIKGLLLWKNNDYAASREYLEKSQHPKAYYYRPVAVSSG